MKGGITNRDICLYALINVGGDVGYVATEDVAVKAFEIYPQRFGLIRHPKYPDVDSVRVTLTDLRKEKYGSLVEGNKKRGWRVSSSGTSLIAENRIIVQKALKDKLPEERRISSGVRLTSEKVRSTRLSRILRSEAFAKWKKGVEPSVYDFYDVMRVDDYTPESTYREHLKALTDVVPDNAEVRKFLSEIDRMYGESYRHHG